MTQHETTMAAAFKRAGLKDGARLHAVISEMLKDAGGGRAKVREVLRSKVMSNTELFDALLDCAIAAVAEDMQGSPGAGYGTFAGKAETIIPASGDAADGMPGEDYQGVSHKATHTVSPTRQQNGGAAGCTAGSDDGLSRDSRPSPTSRGAGAKLAAPEGSRTLSPAREQSEDNRKGSLDAWKSTMAAVNRQFKWLDTLYERHSRKPLIAMTYGELKTLVNGQRRDVQYHVKNACTSAHVAIVARKLMDECDAQGVVPEDARWAEVLPQDRIRQFEEVWTKEKITKEFIRYLADADERTLEVFLSQPEPPQINA